MRMRGIFLRGRSDFHEGIFINATGDERVGISLRKLKGYTKTLYHKITRDKDIEM